MTNTTPELLALPDEILVAIKRPEGYEDVAPELVAEDARIHPAFAWRVIDPSALAAARGQEDRFSAALAGLVYDGNAVLAAVPDRERQYVSVESLGAVLDALVRAARKQEESDHAR